MIDRRAAMAGASLATLLGGTASLAATRDRYGMIGKITALPGRRAELAALMLAGTADMPGCLSYIVAEDLTDPDALWVTEAWDSKASHAASLSLPAVRATIARARPLIAGFATTAEVRPLAGKGMG